jgi:hypothetical protein
MPTGPKGENRPADLNARAVTIAKIAMGKSSMAFMILLLLAGCATTQTKYIKAGATDEDLQRALAGCRVQGAMVPTAAGSGAGEELFQTAVMMQTIDNCMRAQGFVKQP